MGQDQDAVVLAPYHRDETSACRYVFAGVFRLLPSPRI